MSTENQNTASEAYRCNVYGTDSFGQRLLIAVFPVTKDKATAETNGLVAADQFLDFYGELRGPYTHEVVPAELPVAADVDYYRATLSIHEADGTPSTRWGNLVMSDYDREVAVAKSNNILGRALGSAVMPEENGHYRIDVDAVSAD